jgi:hypothetical protein
MIYMLASENEADLVPLSSLLTEEYLAWGVRKNDVELLKAANSFIEALRNDGRLASIVDRWIPHHGLKGNFKRKKVLLRRWLLWRSLSLGIETVNTYLIMPDAISISLARYRKLGFPNALFDFGQKS